MSEAGSPFWQFSLRFYRRPELPALCLHLQDDCGVDVNLLFFLSYLAISGRRVDVDEARRIDAHTLDWRNRVVRPLRAIRRELKGGIAPLDTIAAATLRSAIKRDELQAERLQQEALERAFPIASTGAAAAPRDAASANIAAYSALTGTLPNAAVDALLNALCEEFSL